MMNILDLFILLALSICLQNELGAGFDIHIDPDKVNELVHTTVNFTCRLDNSDTDLTEIVLMELLKDDKPIVILRPNELPTIEKGKESKFQAEGKISTSVYLSYIRVSLSNPDIKDSGPYVCQMYYLDRLHIIKQIKTTHNLTVSNDDLKSAIKYMEERIVNLDTELITVRADFQAQLEKQRTDFTAKESELQDKIGQLTAQTQTHEHDLKAIHENDSFTSAFSVEHPTQTDFKIGDTILFTQVQLNIGGHYDVTTGIYTAPKKGLYTFNLFLTSTKAHWDTEIDLKVNDKTVSSMYTNDETHKQQGYISTVVSLNTGDNVKPVSKTGVSTHLQLDKQRTIFNGYLIKLT